MLRRTLFTCCLIFVSAACGADGSLTTVIAGEIEAEAARLESIADSAERGASPRLSVEIRHIAQIVRLSRGLSPVSVSIDGAATPFHAVTELFFTELPFFPAESLVTGAHIHLWQRNGAHRVLTLISPSLGDNLVASRFSLQTRGAATGELLSRAGEEWQTSSGFLTGGVVTIRGECETPRPPRDNAAFGCRQVLFRQALDVTVTASILTPVSSAPTHRLVMQLSDVEGVFLPGTPVLPLPAAH